MLDGIAINKRVMGTDWTLSSQGIDVGTLTRVQADTVRLLIMILGTLTFGYSTREFEVTADRLGTYRPEEHIEYVDTRLHTPSSEVQLTDLV